MKREDPGIEVENLYSLTMRYMLSVNNILVKFLSFNDLPKSKRVSPEVELGSDSCELRGPFGLGLSNKIYVELCNISLMLLHEKYLTRLYSSFQKTHKNTRTLGMRETTTTPPPTFVSLKFSLTLVVNLFDSFNSRWAPPVHWKLEL